MKIADHLTKEQKVQLNEIKSPKKKRKKKEQVNWKEIMGMGRDTFRRGKGGAIRRR